MPEQVMLRDEQVAAFDTEYVNDQSWRSFEAAVDVTFGNPSRKIRFLDVGGGAGHFAKRVLTAYPNWEVTVLDPAEPLLAEARKKGLKAIQGSVLDPVNPDFIGQFDIISLNWVLHHLVGASSKITDANVEKAMTNVRKMLSKNGMVSVYEHNISGFVVHDSPGRLIYGLTKSKLLAAVTSRLGANTAGVGVRFRSGRAWRNLFRNSGFRVLQFRDHEDMTFTRFRRVVLNMRRANICHLHLVK